MNTDELVAYFVNEVAPVYDSLQNNGKKIYCAILQSLPPEILDEVAAKLLCENATAWDLLRLISWIQKDRPGKTEKPNESVTTLLHWYLDKDSKKVCYAYERLVKRFDAQSYSDQQKILRAFMAGGKKSSEWAATKLRVNGSPDSRKILNPHGRHTKAPPWQELSYT